MGVITVRYFDKSCFSFIKNGNTVNSNIYFKVDVIFNLQLLVRKLTIHFKVIFDFSLGIAIMNSRNFLKLNNCFKVLFVYSFKKFKY